MTEGWFCAAVPKGRSDPEYFAPLSYGRGKEPAPHMLLRRGRASMFPTAREAWNALQETLIKAEEEGATWPKKFAFVVIEVTE